MVRLYPRQVASAAQPPPLVARQCACRWNCDKNCGAASGSQKRAKLRLMPSSKMQDPTTTAARAYSSARLVVPVTGGASAARSLAAPASTTFASVPASEITVVPSPL